MVPELSAEQRARNLETAQRNRHERAELRARMKARDLSLTAVLRMADEGNQPARNMQVIQAIAAMPGYGFKKARKLMGRIGISESRRIRGLGSRQRAALLDVFGKGEE